jgi:hypothetical protein
MGMTLGSSTSRCLFLCLAAWLEVPGIRAASGTPPAIEPVVDLTRAAPAELASDALIRVASLEGAPPNALAMPRRIELLEQAFQMAAASPAPYKRRAAVTRTEGPSGFLDRAYAQDLDALSLRLRAVAALLALDPLKARERFQEIPPLDLPQLTCDDFMIYDVSRYYEVLGQVASQTFTPKEIKDEESAKFVARYLGTIAHPAQVAPAARLLAGSLPLTDAQFQTAVTAFAGALSHISGDDRSFTYAAGEAGDAILALAGAGERRGLSSLVVAGAYREFLVNHLTAARCEDSTTPRFASDPATFFNEHLRTSALPPIGDSENSPAKRDGKAQGLTWCEDPECRSMREQYHALVFKENGGAVQDADRAGNEWQTRAGEFLSALASWNESSGESDAEYFREKVGFYTDLLTVVPNGETRDSVIDSMLAFVLASRPASEDRLQWCLPVVQLVGRVALDPIGMGRAAEGLRRANDPAVALELALELIAPRPVNEFMLLL